MKARSSVAGVLIGLVLTLVVTGAVVGGCAVSGYNKAVRLEEGVKSSWAQVENQLQRRYDLIPNLVETVKGYATHEKELFENIAQARTQYFQPGTPEQRVERANQLEGLLSRLLVLNEKYPELKAQANFLALQDQLEGTENRISVERKRYNDAANELNTYLRSFFGRMFGNWAGAQPAKYFEAPSEAKAAPKVDFGG